MIRYKIHKFISISSLMIGFVLMSIPLAEARDGITQPLRDREVLMKPRIVSACMRVDDNGHMVTIGLNFRL